MVNVSGYTEAALTALAVATGVAGPRDEFIVELAVADGCHAIVTHNIRDFAGASPFRPRVPTPAGFLARLEERS